MTNWLTPETAIGARLPCGAVVVEAEKCSNAMTFLLFDRVPQGKYGVGYFVFQSDGSHLYSHLPNLIPPTPTQPGVYVTREELGAALARVGSANYHYLDAIADALGIPPDPPKVAPWEDAYAEWLRLPGAPDPALETWQAAVEWCVGQMKEAERISGREQPAVRYAIDRIMGDTK